MARTALTPITPPLSNGLTYYPTTPLSANSADVVFAAGDATNGNSVAITNGKTLIMARNTDASAQTITIASVADSFGRKGDITTYSIGADEIAMFGPFQKPGWDQPGLFINVSNVAVELLVLNVG